MGINITQTLNNFQFENRESLRNTAKEILNKQGASQETVHKVVEQTLFAMPTEYHNPQLEIITASSQITLNNSLKETLKYLKSHANKKSAKEPVLGELWDIFSKENTDYNGELIDFEIDISAKNIFAAA